MFIERVFGVVGMRFVTGVLCIAATAVADGQATTTLDKAVAPFDCVGRCVMRPIGSLLPDASQEYQDMAQEAYEALEVPAGRRLAVKNCVLCTKDIFPCPQCTASGTGIIAINEAALKSLPYGAQRFCMFHAVSHVLHRDTAKRIPVWISGLLPFVTSFWLTRHFGRWLTNSPHFRFVSDNRAKYAALWFATVATTSSVTKNLMDKAESFLWCEREKRADLEAARACACHECLVEAAAARDTYFAGIDALPIVGEKAGLLAQPFHCGLNSDDLRRWATLEKKLCPHHAREHEEQK